MYAHTPTIVLVIWFVVFQSFHEWFLKVLPEYSLEWLPFWLELQTSVKEENFAWWQRKGLAYQAKPFCFVLFFKQKFLPQPFWYLNSAVTSARPACGSADTAALDVKRPLSCCDHNPMSCLGSGHPALPDFEMCQSDSYHPLLITTIPTPTTHTCKYPYEKFFWANQSFSLLMFLYHTLNAGQDKTWSLSTLSV